MIYRFETCLLHRDRRELRREGALLALEPQVFDLLAYLIENRHRVVTRDDLMKAVWDGRIVSEASIDTRVSAARQAIGDSGGEQRLIRTLRTKGYRFIGLVREEMPAHRAPRVAKESASPAFPADHPTIAVLPFANSTGNSRQNGVADGITEDLITVLSKIDWLSVGTRAASLACKDRTAGMKQIARQLGARYLLDGSIRQTAGRVRITVQLIDGIANHQLWTHHYDKNTIADFAVLDDICRKVATAFEPQLYLAEHLRVSRKDAANLNAWECILRALSLMNSRDQQNVAIALKLLQKAVTIDPESAQGHSLLSIATTLRVHMSWADRQNVIPGALASAHKALSLNPDHPWAHAALGYAAIWKRPEEAIVPCERAIALNPNFAAGHYFLALASTFAGHYDHVFAHAGIAEQLAQRDLLARGYSGAHDNVRATASFAMENYSQGIGFARNAAAYIPNSPTAHRAMLINLALDGKSDEAKQTLQTLKRVAPKMSRLWIKQNSVWSSDNANKRYIEAFRIAGL